jgi:DNA-binding protein HU-beta
LARNNRSVKTEERRNPCFQGFFNAFSLRSRGSAAIVPRGIPEAGTNRNYIRGGERNSMANPMSKSKIIAHMAEKVSTKEKPVSKKQVVSFFDELFNLAVKEAKSAGKFVIPGIGRAVKAHRKARMGRNPATGEAIKIKAKTVVRLRAAKAFKDAVLK